MSKQETTAAYAFLHAFFQPSHIFPGYPVFLGQRPTLTPGSSGCSCEADRGQASLLSCLQNHSSTVW